jgi:molecular chaperone DnaK (HSP70)
MFDVLISRQATKNAEVIAGLNAQIIVEPTTAAISINFQKKKQQKKKCFIF